MIRVLIIGLGSIGQRHANALVSLGVKEIAAFRTVKGQKDIDSDLNEKVQMFYVENEAFEWNPTHLVISNPTSLHLSFIYKAIARNIKFFVEKPIAENLNDIKIDKDLALVDGVVGYNLRFHGLFQYVKQIIKNKEYGNVINAKLHVGQYLPNWHPYEDYRKGYYAKKDLGGGALRTLSHEIDLMQFLFGEVESVFAKVQHLSDLEIDVDDVTNIIAKTKNCQQVNLHINFLDPIIKRQGIIYLTKGVLHYNFINSIVTFTDNKQQVSTVYSNQEKRNRQYELQMRDFLENEKSGLACSFKHGIEVQRIIDKCIQSNIEKKEICLV